jgi:predicted transcriptional regulator of viral defense system
MKAIELILRVINKMPRGKLFAVKSISKEVSYSNVRQVLSRLAKAGELLRVTRGIYVRPKEVPYLGKVSPGSEEIIKAIAKQTGEVIAVHGAEAARVLHLSTQVPMQSIFYTTGNTRQIKMEKMEITLKHISPRKLVAPGTMTCLVTSALWYLGKNQVNAGVIKKIEHRLKPEQFSEVFKHTEQMPAWMVGAFAQYQRENSNV